MQCARSNLFDWEYGWTFDEETCIAEGYNTMEVLETHFPMIDHLTRVRTF